MDGSKTSASCYGDKNLIKQAATGMRGLNAFMATLATATGGMSCRRCADVSI